MIDALATLLRDLRTAARTLVRQPGFALPVILVLALGICATTGVVRLAGALLLTDPPVTEPGRLAWVIRSDMDDSSFSLPEGEDYGERSGAFQGLALYQSLGADLRQGNEVSRVNLELVSGNYFAVLGVRPLHGRPLLEEDDPAGGGGRAVVVSPALARRLWGSSEAALDRRMVLNQETFTVVGVAPEAFRGLSYDAAVELWAPLAASDTLATFFKKPGDARQRSIRWLRAVGRLPEGVEMAEAQERLDATGRWMAETFPESSSTRDRRLLFRVSDGHPIVREASLPRLVLVLATALVILLVAGANTANLLLARAVARHQELGVRRALGAGRAGLVRHLFTEAFLLFAAGGALGFLAASWIGPLLAPVLPAGIAVDSFRQPDLQAALFALVLTFASALLFGLAPAVRATRRSALPPPNAPASTQGRERQGVQATLVVAQAALSALLLVTCILLLRTVVASYQVDLGFVSDGVVQARVDLGRLGYSPERSEAFQRQVLERLGSHSAIGSASVAPVPPLSSSWMRRTISPEGYRQAPDEDMNVHLTPASPEIFQTLGIGFLAGGPFDPRTATAGSVEVVVNRTLVQRFWGTAEGAVGRRIGMGRDREAVIAGVVEDSHFLSPQQEPEPRIFQPLGLRPESAFTVLARGTGTPGQRTADAATLEVVRSVLRDLEPDLPLHSSGILAGSLDRILAPQRQMALLLSLFGGLTLLVAAVGLYGLLTFTVRRRMRELGIRMALGADAGRIVRSVVSRGLVLTGVGVVAGLAVAASLGHLVRSHLFLVEPTDPLSFTIVAVLMLLVAGAASLAPAGLATRADPVRMLRQE